MSKGSLGGRTPVSRNVHPPAAAPKTSSASVRGEGGVGDGDPFVLPAATITSVTPDVGDVAGGEEIVIVGTNLYFATDVTFDQSGTDTDAASFVVNSDTQITAVTPAHLAADTHVQVTTPAGQTSTGSTNDDYAFCPVASVLGPETFTAADGTAPPATMAQATPSSTHGGRVKSNAWTAYGGPSPSTSSGRLITGDFRIATNDEVRPFEPTLNNLPFKCGGMYAELTLGTWDTTLTNVNVTLSIALGYIGGSASVPTAGTHVDLTIAYYGTDDGLGGTFPVTSPQWSIIRTSQTGLQSTTGTLAPGDVIRLEWQPLGSPQIAAKLNGTTVISGTLVNNYPRHQGAAAVFNANRAGITQANGVSTFLEGDFSIDNFEAGPL